MNAPMYLRATRYLDHDQEIVRTYADKVCSGAGNDRERAIALFYAVRDDIRYDPFSCTLDADSLRASHVLNEGRSYCVGKAVLLAAVGRAAGIPTRLGFADVRNHFTSPQLAKLMGTDIFYYHGYADFFLGGRWVKLTPAFNRQLCEKMNSPALEFDGEHDAIFQEMEHDQGRLRMEYLRYHEPMNDLDPALIFGEYAKRYPAMMQSLGSISRQGSRQGA
jgi:transglutaminase-like putative cysteine protease